MQLTLFAPSASLSELSRDLSTYSEATALLQSIIQLFHYEIKVYYIAEAYHISTKK